MKFRWWINLVLEKYPKVFISPKREILNRPRGR